MQNKIRRIFLVENQFRPKMVAGLILFLLIFILNGLNIASKEMLVRVKREKELVLNIPIMEKLYLSKTQKKILRTKIPDEGPMNLEGTYVKDGFVYALINGEIFSEGDFYGDYKVRKIDFGVAILDNKKTKDRKILQFFYYD